MIKKWLTSTGGLTIIMLTSIVVGVIVFDKSGYTVYEIEWCATEYPWMPMIICSLWFGY